MSTKPRVLFVDDEVMVLQGLRRMLRPMIGEWEMDFRSGGIEALQAMALQPFDVLVSDMRMPGMSGAQLLNATMRDYPSTVRIILSGQSDYESLLQCIAATHQFLAKPCDDQVLMGSIKQALALKRLLHNERLLQFVTSLKMLPSQPPLYLRIIERLQQPEAYVKDVVDIVEKDPAMAAQVLKLVNSAFFGLPLRVSALDEAVSYLGLQTLRLVVLSIGLFEEFHQLKADGVLIESIWAHSFEVARAARLIAELEGESKVTINEAFTAGLLHDIGELVFAVNFSELYHQAIVRSRQTHEPMYLVEEEMLGACHSHVGAYLLGLWGLPTRVVEAVAYHHLPSSGEATVFGSLTAVHVADMLIHQRKPEALLGTPVGLDRGHLQKIQRESRLPVWSEAVRNL